jgi:dTDP-4-dehydrorhamnose reductase
MKILIIGGTSFVGGYFIKYSKIKSLFPTSSKIKKNFIKFNLLSDDVDKIIDKYKITHVVFLSAFSRPQDCEKNKKLSNNLNVIKTKKVLNYLLKKKIYFIFTSSDYIFDGNKGNYSESSIANPKVLYGKQKFKIHTFLKNSKNKNFAILICPKICGENLDDRSIFMNFLSDCLKKKKIFHLANDQIFSPLYVKDLVKIFDILLKENIKGKFNISGENSLNRINFIKKLIKKFNLKNIKVFGRSLSELSDVKNVPLNVSLNNSKIKRKINFKFTNFNQYLKIIKNKYEKKIQKIQ